MQRRRTSSSSSRRLQLILLATAAFVSGGGMLRAQTPAAPETQLSATPIPAERPGDELELMAPLNSTLEFRVARRPWLLEKLTKPATEPGVKMNPPKPPAAEIPDPPSSRQLAPNPTALTPTPSVTLQPAPELKAPMLDAPAAKTPSLDAPSLDDDWLPRGSLPPAEALEDAPDASEMPIEAPAERAIEEPAQSTIAEPAPSFNEAPAETTIEAPADNEEPSTGSVTVRPLRIERDGSPVDGAEPANKKLNDEAGVETKASEPVAPKQSLNSKQTASPEQAASPDESVRADSVRADSIVAESADEPSASLDYTGYPATPIRLNSSVARMQGMMKQCLMYYYARPENANERSNWGMLHSIMIYRADTKIVAARKSYSAIAWMAGNNACRGQKMFAEVGGRISAQSGIGLQGHQAQLLAIFGLCDVPAEYPLYAGNRRFTVQDLIKEEMLACKTGQELTFTLIGLSHYLDTEAVWKNAEGETWDFQRLIREELAQPIVGAACGGTHRLMGFSHALRKRRVEGRPIEGQWKRAEVYGQDFVRYAYRLQNRDGSMSTDWFEGREDDGDMDRKVQTTGHIVEWLLSVTPDSELQDPKLVAAVRFLLTSMYNEREHDWEVGPKGHALRSLAIYYERVYKQGPAWRSTKVATGSSRSRR